MMSCTRGLPPVALLPRLVPGERRWASAGNAAGLLLTALVGAGLVHLLAYHVPLHVPLGPRWVSAAGHLLRQCPLATPLVLLAVLAGGAALLAGWELRRLQRLTGLLAQRLHGRRLALPATVPVPAPLAPLAPRSRGRLVGFVVALAGLQLALLRLAGALCPMQSAMHMDGTVMLMPVAPLLPLAPLHLVVAVGLGLVLWRVERRLGQMRAVIAAHRRLLARASARMAAPPRPAGPLRLSQVWAGLALAARPPPVPACCRSALAV